MTTVVTKLDQAGLDEVTAGLRNNLSARKRAIRQLREDPIAFAEEVFDLDEAQMRALRSAGVRKMLPTIAEAYITALSNPKVQVVYRRTKGSPQLSLSTKLKATAKAKPDDDDDEPQFEGKVEGTCRC